MTENYENMKQTAIVGSIDAVTNPVTFSVVTGSGFPDPDFRILIDSEIFLVTAAVGDSWTATRAVDSTTIGAHSSGAQATHVLTRDSLTNIIEEHGDTDGTRVLHIRKTSFRDVFVSPLAAQAPPAVAGPFLLSSYTEGVFNAIPIGYDMDVARSVQVSGPGIPSTFDFLFVHIFGSRNGEAVDETIAFTFFFHNGGTYETFQAYDRIDYISIQWSFFGAPGAAAVSIGTGPSLGLRFPSLSVGNGSYTGVPGIPNLELLSPNSAWTFSPPTNVGIPEVTALIVGDSGLFENITSAVPVTGNLVLNLWGTANMEAGSYPLNGVRSYVIHHYVMDFFYLRRYLAEGPP